VFKPANDQGLEGGAAEKRITQGSNKKNTLEEIVQSPEKEKRNGTGEKGKAGMMTFE